MRMGIDLGGTKIEAAALDAEGRVVDRQRTPTPGDYDSLLEAIGGLVRELEARTQPMPRLGVCHPGSISPQTGLIRNANSVWLNGRDLHADLERALKRPVRMANDANCLALSEATDGAGAGFGVVFAAILGTGCGGGVVVDGRLLEGRNGMAAEWGHNPLPWARPEEYPGQACWCGRIGCLETWISGPGLEGDFARATGRKLRAPEIQALSDNGDAQAAAALDRHADRTARALAHLCHIIDPDVIVLGGGASNLPGLAEGLTDRIRPYAFSDVFDTPVRRAVHGDSSGVRGAAWLWPPD
ncbi:ROK family protein [Brevundimonas sp. 2R-24]|uniref:ROK family protein n=1 Tax=Peiella sedimenti TaxID=3061083 RepID=A0ABT8SMW2_9CAUL|nr:ROK family protein [Caulobacteraceae bacterium XZ-24]